METNLIGFIGLAIPVIAGAITLFGKISKLEGRLDTLESKKGLHEQVEKIQNESIQKLQQWATELHDSTKAQLDRLAADIAQQQTKVDTSLQALKTQEASLAVLTERAQRLPQEIERHVQQLQSTREAEFARLTNDIDEVKQALSPTLRAEMDKIQDESIRKLHDSTKKRLDQLAQQQEDSLQELKTQEASSLAVLTERAQQLVQQFQEIEQGVQQLRSTTEAESARLTAEIVQQRAQMKQEIEQEMVALRQEKVKTRLASLEVQVEKLSRWLWWSQLDKQWQAIFKEAIGIKSEPTEDELVAILSLTKLNCQNKKLTSLEPLLALTSLQTLNCGYNQLTSLEPLLALTGLQSLDCSWNPLTRLEPLQTLTGLRALYCQGNQLTNLELLHGLKNLQKLWCGNNPSLSLLERERFKKAVPSCQVIS